MNKYIYALLIVGFYCIYLYPKVDSRIRTLFYISIFLKITLLIMSTKMAFPYSNSSDAIRFVEYSYNVASSSDILNNLDLSSSYIWAWFIGFQSLFTKDFFLIPKVINICLSSSTIYLSYEISKRISNKNISYKSYIFLVFNPSLMFISITLLREIVMIYFSMKAINYFIEYLNSCKTMFFIFSLLFSFLSILMHGGMIVLLLVIILFYFYTRIKAKDISILFGIMILFILFTYAVRYKVGAAKLNFIYSSDILNALLLQIENKINLGVNYGYISEPVRIRSFSNLIIILIELIFKFIYSPFFPLSFRVYSIEKIVISIVLNIAFIIILVKNIIKSNIINRFLVVYFLLFIIIFSLGTFDQNTAYRHFLKILPIYSVLFFNLFSIKDFNK